MRGTYTVCIFMMSNSYTSSNQRNELMTDYNVVQQWGHSMKMGKWWFVIRTMMIEGELVGKSKK